MNKNTDEHMKKTSVKDEDEKKKVSETSENVAETDTPPAGDQADEVPADSDACKAQDSAGASDLSVRVKELEKLNADLQDQYLRKAADFDNYRKRMIREKQEAIDYANTGLLLELVQILDDFDRAIEAVTTADDTSGKGAFSEGISMIRNQLGSMLETKYGLVYFPSKDTTFDPNIHEAIGTVPDPEVQEPTVAEEYLKGYKLKERVIRAAKVIVKMPQEAAAE